MFIVPISFNTVSTHRTSEANTKLRPAQKNTAVELPPIFKMAGEHFLTGISSLIKFDVLASCTVPTITPTHTLTSIIVTA